MTDEKKVQEQDVFAVISLINLMHPCWIKVLVKVLNTKHSKTFERYSVRYKVYELLIWVCKWQRDEAVVQYYNL